MRELHVAIVVARTRSCVAVRALRLACLASLVAATIDDLGCLGPGRGASARAPPPSEDRVDVPACSERC